MKSLTKAFRILKWIAQDVIDDLVNAFWILVNFNLFNIRKLQFVELHQCYGRSGRRFLDFRVLDFANVHV